MGQFFTEIPSSLFPWIRKQKMFWVATAPLSPSGHVNVSPKGYEGTFHIVDEKRIWYEDLTGSGVETIAHLKENGRMTIMLAAFDGPPRIVRLFGVGTVHEFGSPEYEALIPTEKRHIGSRSAIVLDIDKVGSSCGYAVPFFDFKAHRTALDNFSVRLETADRKAETESCAVPNSPFPSTKTDISSKVQTYPLTDKGLKAYWKGKNYKSIDGLPGVSGAYQTSQTFSPDAVKAKDVVNSSVQAKDSSGGLLGLVPAWEREKYGIILGFVLGALAMVVAQRSLPVLAGIQ